MSSFHLIFLYFLTVPCKANQFRCLGPEYKCINQDFACDSYPYDCAVEDTSICDTNPEYCVNNNYDEDEDYCCGKWNNNNK